MEVMPTRRSFIRSACAAGLSAAAVAPVSAASDFWNKKEPSAWSAEEVETLKTKSPWAKKIRGEYAGNYGGGRGGRRGDGGGAESMDRSGSRGSFGGMSGADSNGIGGGGGRGGGRGGMGGDMGAVAPAAPQGPELVVRWMTAKPVSDAMKFEIPPDLADHYGIGVSGLTQQMFVMALLGGRGRGRAEAAPELPEDPAARQKLLIDRLMQSATLSAKGRDTQTADQIRQTADKQTLIFGFARKDFPLAGTDKDVQFTLKLGPLTVKAKFEPKEMSYKGELSL